MKKLLLLVKKLLVNNLRYYSAALLLIVLLVIGKSSQAQVYYITNDAVSGSASAQDGFIKINYDGTGKTSLGSSITNSPGIIALDLPHDRAFVYEQFSSSPPTNLSIKVVTLSTGALIKTITFTQAARIAALKYDAVNDYIYYVLQDSAPTTVSATNDALCRVKPDGTGQTVLLAGFCKNPGPMALDIPNNRLFVMENLNADRAFLTISLATNTVTQTSSTISTAGIAGVYADYDPDTDFIYLLSSDNTVSTTVTDAIYKLHPDGSGFVSVKGSIGSRPITGAFDFPHGKAYFFDNNTTRQLNSIDLSSGTITEMANINTFPTNGQITGIALPARPVVSTTSASSISSGSATLAGNVVESDVSVTDRGVVYSSSNSTPTIGGTGVTKAANGTGTGVYSASISGLGAVTTYYVRAYAISTAGTAYGTVSSFTTLSNDATLSGLSLSAGSLNPSFSSGTITYTASVANSNSTITVTPTRNNANASIKVQGTTVNSGSASGNINLAIGDNAISTVVTAQDGSTTKTYTVTVNRPKASQTITFNALSTKTYGNSDFSPGASASSGLGVSYSSDNTAVATIVGGNIHIVAAGTANITASQAGDANTLAANNVSQALTVSKAAVTVTATAASKNYGDSDPTFAYTITSGALAGTDAFIGALTRDAGVNVGNYNITQGTLALSANYTLSFIGGTLTINKRPITIQPLAATKTYGDADPTYPYNISSGSLASGDGFTGSFTRVAGETPGTYALSVGTKRPVSISNGADQSGNYTLTFTPDNLTITKRLLTLQPNPQSKVYGAADPAFPYKITGTLAAGEGMTGVFGRPTGENAGIYALTLGTKMPVNITTGASTAAYYTISFVSDNLTITRLDEVITVSPQSKTYGDADPVLAFHYSNPLPFTDTFSGALTRSPGESVGSYNITQGTLALNTTNYNLVSFTGSTFTINAKTINVAANAQTKTYGDADPALTYTADALVTGDGFTGALTRVAGEAVGTHAINQGSLALSSNYAISYTGNNLIIGQKTINVAANAQTKTYGDADPVLTYTADALASGDAFSGSLTRDAGETVGAYNITQGSLALNANYNLNYTGNSLAIGKATLSYLATPASKNYLAANPVFTGIVTGFLNSDTQASAITGTLSFASTATASSPTGNYPIIGSGLSAANYNFIQSPANSTALSIVLSSDATLSNLSVSQGTFNTPFNAGTYQYFASVANSVTSFDLTAIANQVNATLTVNGTPLSSGLATTLPLSAGTNNFTIVVTAQDGTTTQSYLVGINRALSSNNLLSSITMSGVTLNPTFDSGTLTYTSSVGNLVTATDINATPADDAAVAQVAGNRISAVTSYHQPLVVGDNPLTVTGIAQNGDTRNYLVTITRAPSSDASLSAINTTGFSLIEPFSSATYNYTANVTASVAQVNFVPVSTNNSASITVNGAAINSLGFTATLSFGVNTFNVIVTAQDGATTSTYTLNVTRALSSDATLSSLSLPYITTINEPFDPAVFNYTANLADSTITGLPLTAISNDVNASVKINGDAVPRFTNYVMALHGGDNTFNIVVTPQDNSATKTYTLVLTRAGQAPPLLSPDASLAAISISATGYSHNFNFAFDVLTPLTIANKITAVRLHPVTGNTGATTTVNGVAIAYDASTDLLPLNLGDNTFDVVVTAADGVHQTTTTIHINRLPAADISLASLALNTGTLSPAFVGTTLTYTATVPYSISSLNITPVANATDATVTVGATTISAGTPSASVPLNVSGPPNRIRITVTAADGVNAQTYTVNVTRLAPDASLASVGVSGGSSVTHPTSTTYATQVDYNTAILTVTATAVDPGSTITVDGNPVVSGSASAGITLDNTAGATTTIPIVVTAPDGTTTQSYSLLVTHLAQPASGDATLTGISTTTTLSPVFSAGTYAYTAVANDVTTKYTLTPVTNDPNATTTVNGEALVSGKAVITLVPGNNIITTTVTAQDGTIHNYTITVFHSILSSNTGMSFKIDPASSLTVVSATYLAYSYSTSVSSATNSVRITPTLRDLNAIITIEGQTVASGNASNSISLNATGTTTVHMTVTAADGLTKRDYPLTITKDGSSDANLTSLMLNPTSTLIATTGSSTINYQTSVPASTTSVSVTATASTGAVITVNGNTVQSGVASAPITLNSTGATSIVVLVTAGNGTTVRSYSIQVYKDGSSDAYLTSLKLNPTSALTVTTGSSTVNYQTTVPTSTTSVTVTAKAAVDAVIKINGNIVQSGVASAPVALNPTGATSIAVLVTAGNGTTVRSYSILVYKKGSSNAYLTSLKLNPSSTLTVITGSSTVNYKASVSESITSVTVTAKAVASDAVIKINGNTVQSGVASAPVALNSTGATSITVLVTAGDGTTVRSYSIMVYKNGSSDAFLTSLKLNPESTLTATSGSSNVNYQTTVPGTTANVTVTAISAIDAVINVEGIKVNNGVASAPITLNSSGATTIHIDVTAADGIGHRTYSIVVSKDSAINLNSLVFEPAGIAKKSNDVLSDELIVHQALSPNGDGQNDILTIDGIENHTDNHLSIMNAGGTLVYDVKGYGTNGNVFDGHSNKTGTMQKPGTYYYSLEYNDGKETKRKTGYIIIKY